MGASGSDIQISITVVDKNGVATVKELESAVASMGAAGEQAGQRVADGLDELGSHAKESLEHVRLLNEDLGLRIPRAMQNIIASSGLLSSAIGAIGGGLVAMGAIDILSHIGEGIHEAYEKWIDVDAVTQQYQKHLDEIAEKKFIDPGQVSEAIAHLQQVGDQLDALNAKKAQGSWGVFQPLIGGQAYTPGDEKKRTALLEQQRQLEESAQKYSDESVAHGLAQQEKFVSVTEKGFQQINDLKSIADARSKNKFDEGGFGDVSENYAAAYDKYQDELTDNAAEATAKRIALGREEAQEIQRMRAESLQAGLEGNALYAAQDQSAIDQVTLKFHEGEISKQAWASETASIQQKFAAEATKRQDDLDAQTRKMEADSAAAGLTGIAKIQAENRAALDAIDEIERKAVGKGGVETPDQKSDFDRQRVATAGGGAQKQMEAERQYYEQMNQMMEGFTAQSKEGYARIYADADKSAQSVWKSWQTTWGQLDAMDAGWVDSVNDAANRVTQIYANADKESARLHQQTMDSLKKEEEEAARAILPPWQAAEMAIEATYNERTQRAREALAAQKIDQDEYNQEMVTAWTVATAQMTRQMQDTRDRLAGALQSFMKNPQQYIENRALDTAFQYMSNEMMQLFHNHSGNAGVGMLGWLFGMNGSPSTSTNAATFGKSLFGMGGSTNNGIPGFDQLTSGATTLVTGATTLQTGSQMLLQAAQQLLATGGVGGAGGVGSDMMMPGFGGISAGSSGASSGAAAASVGGFGSAGASGGFSSADIASLTTESGPDAMGGGFSAVGGGMAENAATTAGTSASPWLGAAGAAITGVEGLYSAYQNSNPLAGAVSGAMSGAAIGSAFAPGIGTAIGAVVGGIAGILAGLFGDKGKSQAQDLDNKTVQPGIATELQQFNNGSTGYTQASQFLDQLQIQAMNQTNSWGSGARSWYTGHILPEIQAAQAIIAQEEKGNRSLVALSAAQYHSGGLIGDFGDLALNSSEGYILAQRGEMMMTAAATSTYAPMLHAMNSGSISPGALRGSQMVSASGSAGGPQINISAWDAQGVMNWLRNGGATQLRQGLNMGIAQYGGNGVR